MRHRALSAAPFAATLLAAASLLAASPALAQGRHGRASVVALPPMAGPAYWGGRYGGWYGSWQQPWVIQANESDVAPPPGPPPQNRDEWLRECRRRLSDNGVGGAVIGGVLGGVAGNVIAGQGSKTLGTIAGAAVGAVAGAAIDKAEDRGPARDRCEAMLDTPAYGYSGYGAAPYGTMLVPVMMVPVQAQTAPEPRPECKETVTTEEFVTYVPRRSRHIPPRAPDKRVRLVPDKRVPQ